MPEYRPLVRALARFATATPALLEGRQLLRRSDTKFLATPDQIAAVLERVDASYAVLPAGTELLATYASRYFDTPELRCYHDHRRGRRLRHKIRIRRYADRGLAFLEIKSRRNDLHTDKARLPVAYETDSLDPMMIEFLRERCSFAHALVPSIEITFRRITLVGIATNERATIDVGIFGVAIVEVKQPSRSLTTPIMQALRAAAIAPCSISKYVTALATTTVRNNRFRPVLRELERCANR